MGKGGLQSRAGAGGHGHAGLMVGQDSCGMAAGILVFILQANVEHLTDKMKTDIQRGLVLR